ncbi:hypothetical protein CYLTODRAFT_494748 [Cylindrobasidium torrendii FP15055 ss-10]|uniref:Uncharacterized protein n=1 Tax=Cylindrobasidium torrendii FP15055 ss-10 TaxID=1314674 RepID=A0A0D7AWC1_9AGAR|nr:hypothetical protein CYLTODRAFT_494748 [Cylindrobasidium torrendii FP15055 ss-10]
MEASREFRNKVRANQDRLCEIIAGLRDDITQRDTDIDRLEQTLHRAECSLALKQHIISKLKKDVDDPQFKSENQSYKHKKERSSVSTVAPPVSSRTVFAQGGSTSSLDDAYSTNLASPGPVGSWAEEVFDETSDNPPVKTEPEGINQIGKSKRTVEDKGQSSQEKKRARR